MRTLALSALALLLAAPALAQDAVVLAPGHPDLMTADLDVGSETTRLRVDQPRTRELGTITTTVERDGDRVVLVTDADAQQAGQVYQSTVTMQFPTLAPVRREFTAGSTEGVTDYDGTTVSGTFGRGDWEPLPFDITLRTVPFAPEALPMVARALPFEAGYTATVPTFTAANRVRDYTLEVIGPEDYTRADGSTVATWVVEQTLTATRGPGPRRFYVDAETRALVASTASGQGDAVIVSEPVTAESLAALDAQTPAVALRPGLDHVDTQALASYTQDFVVRLVEPQQMDVGTMSRALTVDAAAQTVTLETELAIPMAGQMTSETLVAAYPSLRPLSNRTMANGTEVALDFSEAGMTGTRTPADGEAEAIDQSFEEPVFDGSWLFEIVRLIPLEEGFRGTLHSASPSDGTTEMAVSVIEQTEVDGRAAWVVEATPDGGAPTEITVDAETRDLLQIRLFPQPGVTIAIEPTDAEAGTE